MASTFPSSTSTTPQQPHASRTGDASRDVSDNYKALQDDIASLADSVRRLAGEQIGSTVTEVQDKATEQLNSLEKTIRRNPTQAALVAAGVGFVVGLIMMR